MKNTYQYFTTPIFYVNGQPHLGHAYTTFLTDLYARYSRLLGYETFFLTGTDEHGQKIEQTAKKEGITPIQLADDNSKTFRDLWKVLNISNDDFIRTTEQRHKEVVKGILLKLYEKGDIYKKEYEGYYCTPCEIFLTETELQNSCACPQCGRDVNYISETNYFFRMSHYAQWLIEYIKSNEDFILPKHKARETLGFLEKGLNDLCISRPKERVSWGIEIPFDPDFVTYVWFDALTNYISAIGYPNSTQFERYWANTHQFIGKDILTTHTVYWTTMLKSLQLPMPKTIFAHGWWLVDDEKMSKSLNNSIEPMEVAEKYGIDPFRYFLITAMTPGQDSSFSHNSFITIYNGDLANDIGNILNRIVKMICTSFDGYIPSHVELSKTRIDDDFRNKITEIPSSLKSKYSSMNIHIFVSDIASGFREINKYLNDRKPWALANNPNELGLILYYAAEAFRILTGLLHPVMPSKIEEARRIIGYSSDLNNLALIKKWGVLDSTTRVHGGKHQLFPRIQ